MLTKDQYVRFLSDETVTRDVVDILQVHYNMPNRTARYTQLGEPLKFSQQKISAQYAKLGKFLAEKSARSPDVPANYNQHGLGWWSFIGTMVDLGLKNIQMHDGLAQALEELGWTWGQARIGREGQSVVWKNSSTHSGGAERSESYSMSRLPVPLRLLAKSEPRTSKSPTKSMSASGA